MNRIVTDEECPEGVPLERRNVCYIEIQLMAIYTSTYLILKVSNKED